MAEIIDSGSGGSLDINPELIGPTIKSEIEGINDAKENLAQLLINKFGVQGLDILDENGNVVTPGLVDGEGTLKRLAAWSLVIDNTSLYWADQLVSNTAIDNTTPLFARIGLGVAPNSTYSLITNNPVSISGDHYALVLNKISSSEHLYTKYKYSSRLFWYSGVNNSGNFSWGTNLRDIYNPTSEDSPSMAAYGLDLEAENTTGGNIDLEPSITPGGSLGPGVDPGVGSDIDPGINLEVASAELMYLEQNGDLHITGNIVNNSVSAKLSGSTLTSTNANHLYIPTNKVVWDALLTKVSTDTTINSKELSSNITLYGSDIAMSSSDSAKLNTSINNKVPLTRTINSKALSSNIILYGGDIKMSSSDATTLNTAINNKVPTTRTINGVALSSNITNLPVNEADLKWGGRNLDNNYSPIDATLLGMPASNRFSLFATPNVCTHIEYSTNGGTTWTTKDNEDVTVNGIRQHRTLHSTADTLWVGHDNLQNYPICSANISSAVSAGEDANLRMLRITVDLGKRNSTVEGNCSWQILTCNKIAIYTSIANSAQVKIDVIPWNKTTLEHDDANPNELVGWTRISGYPGWAIFNFTKFRMGSVGNSTSIDAPRKLVFTFKGRISVNKIWGFGDYSNVNYGGPYTGHYGTPYKIDTSGNVEFQKGVTSNGNVSVTGVLNGAELNISGDAIIEGGITASRNITAAAFYESSDKNLKQNIYDINSNDLYKISQLNFKEFEFKSDGIKKYGVIAQDLQELNLNNLVSKTEEDEHLTVDYISMLCLKIAYLEERIKHLEHLIK